MREIKFRQPLRTGGFHYWGYLKPDCFTGPCGPNYSNKPSEEFTGLHGNNGVEIYKGDIIRYETGSGDIVIGPVVFKEGEETDTIICGFGVDAIEGNEYNDMPFLGGIEKLGNIHENPELMEANYDHS